MHRRRRQNLCHQKGFDPRFVPEVAAGYWWHAERATGLGTAAFKVPEGNGHTSFDLVQATVASQPTALTENGVPFFRMRKAADSNPSWLATAGAVTAGWTGPTYLGMWLRHPDAAGDVTGSNTLFAHFNATGNQRRLSLSEVTGTPDLTSSANSVNGASVTGLSTRWSNVLLGGGWCWCELAFDLSLVLGGAAIADKVKMFLGFALQARLLDNTTDQTALFDASSPIQVASRSGNLANTDTTDWAAAYYCNGIPSLANRKLLANTSRPIAAAFS